MPQDIPLEASNTLAFTPACLQHLELPPVFNLRAATWREKDLRLTLQRRNGVILHSERAIREEVLRGLAELWTPEQFLEFSVQITSLWDAQDAYAVQLKADPDLVWQFDKEVEASVKTLIGKLERNWPPLAEIAADTERYSRVAPVLYLAVLVKDWTGIEVERKLDTGHLSLDTAFALRDELFKIEERAGLEPGAAWGELYAKCLTRMHLDEEEAKNFASPSPSETNPERSSGATRPAAAGKSPASASSRKTRKGA